MINFAYLLGVGGAVTEISCGGHHHGSALDGVVLDFTQILVYLVHNMSRSQLYLGVWPFWLAPFFFHFCGFMVKLYFICWNYSLELSSGWHIFSCDQAALQMVFSVCLSVRLTVRLSHLFHHVPIIVSSWNFQELLPWSKVMSLQKVKVRGQRSRSQRSTPNLAVSGL